MQLPDDPDELQRMLEEIAGPGATIRVDGFTGGRLPTRDQIARIVVRRDAYSAEFHQVGQGRVEIATRPGVDRWRGNAGLNVRPSGLSATNAVAPRLEVGHTGSHERVRGRAARPESRLVLDRHRRVVVRRHARDFGAHADRTGQRDAAAAVRRPRRLGADRRPADEARRCSARRMRARPPSAATRASRSSICRSAATSARTCQHNVRFSLEGGQRRPFHVRLQLDQSKRDDHARHDRAAPSSCRSAFRAGGATSSGARSRPQRHRRHDVHAESAALHAARRLAGDLGPQRAGAAPQQRSARSPSRTSTRTTPTGRPPTPSEWARRRWPSRSARPRRSCRPSSPRGAGTSAPGFATNGRPGSTTAPRWRRASD